MTRRATPWPPGTPCWAELAAPDVPAALAFYGAVLPWTFAVDGAEAGGAEGGGAEGGGHVIARVGGAAAAGIGPPVVPGVPAGWTLYLAGEDVDRTADAVVRHGGALLLPPGDVGPPGRRLARRCLAADPSGAVFGVWQAGARMWQAGARIGAEVASEVGGILWEDLRSTAPEAARAFYRGVFGVATTPLEAAGPDYHTFSFPGDPAPLGGMGGMAGAAEGSPSHWLVYFAVADAGAAVAAARSAGGTVPSPVEESPYGRMAMVVDPSGAAFMVMEDSGEPGPER